MFDEKPDAEIDAVKQSQTGKRLTEGQLSDAMNLTGVIRQHIHKTGSFIEPLTDYAHAFARNEKFDALRAEKMVRDVYTAVQGQSMNKTREALMAAETNLPDNAKTRALDCAETIEQLIQAAPTQPFYQAYDRAAVTLSAEFAITQSAAKAMMKETFEAHHGKDLYAHGKSAEETHHKPVRDAEIASRQAEKQQTRIQNQSYG